MSGDESPNNLEVASEPNAGSAEPSVGDSAAPTTVAAIAANERIMLDFMDADWKRVARLTFKVIAVDVNDQYITLMTMPDFALQPEGATNFTLYHRNKPHRVIWLGGNFKFTLPTGPVSGISFLRNKPPQNDDERRNDQGGPDAEPA